jgi:hypothetical protein
VYAAALMAFDRLLKHPNIMELIAWQVSPFMIIVTRFMRGGNLFHLIHNGNIEDAFPFVKILRDIVSVVANTRSVC